MANIKTKLLNKKEIASDTMAFYFEKPASFSYIAGQYMGVTLVNPPENDSRGNTHVFSLVSAPSEDYLMIATRMRDTAFKRVLRNMLPGTEIEITEAMGSFNLHNNASRVAVFLIGGIGIAPVRSIIVEATKKHLSHKLFLFYSNRRSEDAAFLDELTQLQQQNFNYKFIATMTEVEQPLVLWTGETGHITADTIKKYIIDRNNVTWYLAGPIAMVKAMRDVLIAMRIDSDHIKTEEFPGY